MKSYLVDVPVALYVFVRHETLKDVFAVVKKARPSILFLIGDGPRDNNPSDIENIKKSREIVNDIDWECKVYKLYTDHNKGMYATGKASKDFIFQKVDRCIFLEDDVIVSVSFFQYCAELLEKYKNDLRVHYVTGMNYLGSYSAPSSDYFFANEGSIWGFATWRRTYIQQNLKYREDKYMFDKLIDITNKENKRMKNRIEGYAKSDIFEGHVAGTEFYKGLLTYSQNQVFIVPKNNMVSNIGLTSDSVHAPNSIKKLPKGIQQVFHMKIYECNFPLKHPDYLIRDIYYEKKVRRIMAWGHPLIAMYRNIERAIRYIYYGDTKRLLRKIKGVFSKNSIIEK